MKSGSVHSQRSTWRPPVIALHCSGAGASQWHSLAEALGGDYEVLAPEHYGAATSGAWTGEHSFTLADDAAAAIALVDASQDKVHLVGHSYGGGVALEVALARTDQITSMVLYEPSAFHLLPQMGDTGAKAFYEILGVAQRICSGLITGDYRRGVGDFVDYWNGAGTWDGMRPAAQRALMRWAPKGPLDFRALITNETPPSAYRALKFPVLIIRGEHAPKPTRLIADRLPQLLPDARLIVVDGAGHMGPFTHASEVSRLIVSHIIGAEGNVQRLGDKPWSQANTSAVFAQRNEVVS
ncbi:MAG: alpha/beta hydrolase [Xanthobacteraceae bacterium]|jgi:pimeloyl-ACP methyl ester carboxylesterase